MLSRYVCILVFVCFLAVPAFAQVSNEEALFGLKWNMSLSDIKGENVTLTKERADRNFETYTTVSLPKDISDIEKYSLIFSEGKLVKIIAVGKNITDDVFGRTGKERFDVIKNTLADKYGKPTINAQIVGRKLYSENDEFYQCLAYSGCGLWAYAVETQTKNISLQLRGLRRGIGYIEITAEAVPYFSDALAKYKDFKSKSDKDAL